MDWKISLNSQDKAHTEHGSQSRRAGSRVPQQMKVQICEAAAQKLERLHFPMRFHLNIVTPPVAIAHTCNALLPTVELGHCVE